MSQEKPLFFQLSPRITMLPMIYGSGDFALEVRRRMLADRYDCVAVPLPPSFELSVEEAIEFLPAVTVVAQKEYRPDVETGGEEAETYNYVPIDPCQGVIMGIRTAMDYNLPRVYIDLETEVYEEQQTVLPDAYALKHVSLEKFAAALLPALPRPEKNSQQFQRICWMAFQLHRLELEHDSILFMCSMMDWVWIRDAYQERYDYPFSTYEPWYTQTYDITEKHLYFVLGELPFITHLYERRRAEMLPEQTMTIDGVKALLLEARKAWAEKHKLKHHWLTPQRLSLYLKYVRNLTLMDRRLSPDLYTLALAAKQIGGDDFAITLIEKAREYPFPAMITPYEEIEFGIREAAFPEGGQVVMKNRLQGNTITWQKLPLQPNPPTEKKHEWKMQWDPRKQCSWPPEDEKIESFHLHVREQARRVIGEDLARNEKFTTSLKDGLDMRETLRNWHTGDIYVKELPPSRGTIDVVIMLFEIPADPMKFSWHTTWYAEHQEESTLCFYSTDYQENIIGPGIGEAMYGGCFFIFPPRLIPDVWTDSRFLLIQTLEEKLITAACSYAKEKRVVLLAPTPPALKWRQIAKRYKKHLVYLPLKRFSGQAIDRLRKFHVLNGKEVRSYAAKFIRDFR